MMALGKNLMESRLHKVAKWASYGGVVMIEDSVKALSSSYIKEKIDEALKSSTYD